MSAPADGRRLLVVTGEASGDEHAAGLVRAARATEPSLRVDAVGGEALAAAGATILHDARELAVVGFSEVFERLPALLRAMSDLKRRLRDDPPDALLLVDFPDFNLRLARAASRRGVPVVYFVSPQVWAWREGRVETIRSVVTRMIVLFPFEEAFYRERGVPAVCVGHPVSELAARAMPRDEARREIGLPAAGDVFGLLPGSRRGEVRRHLDLLLETAERVLEARPGARFVVPVAGTVPDGLVEDRVAATSLPIVARRGDFATAARACDAAVAASGTATLQLAVLGVPAVVVYRLSAASTLVARAVVRVPHVSLVNLVAERRLVPELVQDAFTPERAASELLALAPGGPERARILAGLDEVRERLGGAGAYERAARELFDVLDSKAAERRESAR